MKSICIISVSENLNLVALLFNKNHIITWYSKPKTTLTVSLIFAKYSD